MKNKKCENSPLILSKSFLISYAQPWQCMFTLSTTIFSWACFSNLKIKFNKKTHGTRTKTSKAWDFVSETLSSFFPSSFFSSFSSSKNLGEISSTFLLYFFLSLSKTFSGSIFLPCMTTLWFALSIMTSWTPNKINTYKKFSWQR